MRALVTTAAHVVEFREVAEPTPAPDEAVIAVNAFGLNRGEVQLISSRPDGWRPGQDIAGTIVAAAANGAGPAVGTRVVALVDQAGWAERVAVPVQRIAPLPDAVSFTQAASLPVAGLTALRTLRVGGSLLGRQVLITGASGGVGSIAVQLAAHAGAHVAGLVGHAERAAAVQALGATRVFAAPDQVDGAFDLIIESVGGDSLAAAITHLAPDGTTVVFGNSSGQPTALNFFQLASRPRSRIYTFTVYDTEKVSTISFSDDLSFLATLVASAALKPQIGLQASWRDFGQDATGALRDRRFAGKAVFTVA